MFVAGVPASPFCNTRFSTCDGAVPVIVAAAMPWLTVPIESVLAAPAAPVIPRGMEKLNLAA